MVVILVRHGESQSNVFLHTSKDLSTDQLKEMNSYSDPLLTEVGKEHAEQTGQYLKHLLTKTCTIWVSPFARAQETASALVDQAHKVVMIPELQEYTPANKSPPPDFIIDNDWESFCKRVLVVKERLRAVQRDEVVVVYGHSLFFSVLLSHLAMQEQAELQSPEIALHLPNCSISTLSWVTDHWEIYNIGSIAHLKNPTGTHVPFGMSIP